MRKTYVSVILALVLVLGLSIPAFAAVDPNDPSTWVVVECTGPAHEEEQEVPPPAEVDPNDPSTWVVVECTGPANEEEQAPPAVENDPQPGAGTTYTAPATENTNSVYSYADIPAVDPAANNKIIVRQIDVLSADESSVTLSSADYVVLGGEELNEYYGINIFPTVPEDIKEWEDQQHGVYKANGGTGEVYWDGTILNYSNEDFSKTINVEIEKDSLPLCDYVLLAADEEKSIINNVEVAIAQSENGYLYAQFVYSDVGFQLTAKGLTQEEFVDVISSLISTQEQN